MRKRFCILLTVAFILAGCAGFKPDIAVNMTTDIVFATALAKHPESKRAVIAALIGIKTVLAQPITYDALVLEIARQFHGENAYVELILMDYLRADRPVSETYLTLFDEYKAGLTAKLDRLILIASM